MQDIMVSPYLLRDLGRMSPLEQTARLESFHSVPGFFTSNSVYSFYNQMKAR